MLNRQEIEERLAELRSWNLPDLMEMEIAMAETAQQLAEWLESTLEAELASEGIAYMPTEARAWLEGKDADQG